jgi:hypothetical protein
MPVALPFRGDAQKYPTSISPSCFNKLPLAFIIIFIIIHFVSNLPFVSHNDSIMKLPCLRHPPSVALTPGCSTRQGCEVTTNGWPHSAKPAQTLVLEEVCCLGDRICPPCCSLCTARSCERKLCPDICRSPSPQRRPDAARGQPRGRY